MMFAMSYFTWVGIFGILIAATFLIVGFTFGFRLMKVSYAPAWAVVCVAVLGAYFAASGSVSEALLILLFGVPLLGAAVYLITRLTFPKQVGIVAAVGLFVFVFLVLQKSNFSLDLKTDERSLQTDSTNTALMNDQAARVRFLREDYDRQQREIFDAGVTQSSSEGVSASGSSSGEDQLQTLKSSSGVAWYPEVDERFDADNYPSMSAAGRALGRQLVGLIDHSTEAEQGPPIIQINASQTRMHDDFENALNELAAVMRSQYPEAQVLVDHLSTGNSVSRLDPQAVSIQLRMSVVRTRTPAPWSASEREMIVNILAELDTGSNKVSTRVRMNDKPWVDDFDEFVNSNRGNGIVFDGRSGRLAMTQMEARGAALDDAVSMLTPLAMEVLKAQNQLLVQSPDEREIAGRLKKELLAGELVVDSFSQQLTHPMGNLWREAVLVRVDYPWLERVFSNYLQQRQDEQRGRLSLGAALTLLVIGIVVLHGLLNWITKGYHRKSVGMLSGLFAVVGVLDVVFVALRLSGPGHL